MDLIERNEHTSGRHPWELARRDFVAACIGRAGLGSAQSWLDVGSGDGWLARSVADGLTDGAVVDCYDPNYTPADICRYAGEPTSGTIRYVRELPNQRADVVMLFDVLEHVDDEEELLTGLVRTNLNPSGVVLVTVPAHQHMFTSHDVALRHHRRYSRSACRDLFSKAGLGVVADGGLFHSLLVPRLLSRIAESVTRPDGSAGVGAWNSGPFVSGAVYRALRSDVSLSTRMIGSGRYLPGLSYWAICALPGDSLDALRARITSGPPI